MIATIVLGISLIIVITLAIILCREESGEGIGTCAIFSIAFILVLILSLCAGESIYKQDNTKLLEEKEYIEYCLDSKPSLYVIEQAKEYNYKVQDGNNYWCRFNIEDRNEYLIDIDKYIKGEE